MLSTRSYLGIAGAVLLTTVGAEFAPRAGSGTTPVPSEPRAILTADVAFDRAQAVAPLISSRAAGLPTTVEPFDMSGADGRQLPCWEVSMAGGGSRVSIHLMWRGDTGDLVYASTTMPAMTRQGATAQLSEAEAVEASAAWVQRLGFVGRARGWRLDSKAQRAGDRWQVYWRSADLSVLVTLSANDGGLQWAESSGHTAFGLRRAHPGRADIHAPGR